MCRCYNCGQELVEIDNRGQRLTGCLTCNLWTAGDAKGWTRLSEEDLRALHPLRHGGHKIRAPTVADALSIQTENSSNLHLFL